jgi:hypothetical protein
MGKPKYTETLLFGMSTELKKWHFEPAGIGKLSENLFSPPMNILSADQPGAAHRAEYTGQKIDQSKVGSVPHDSDYI